MDDDFVWKIEDLDRVADLKCWIADHYNTWLGQEGWTDAEEKLLSQLAEAVRDYLKKKKR